MTGYFFLPAEASAALGRRPWGNIAEFGRAWNYFAARLGIMGATLGDMAAEEIPGHRCSIPIR